MIHSSTKPSDMTVEDQLIAHDLIQRGLMCWPDDWSANDWSAHRDARLCREIEQTKRDCAVRLLKLRTRGVS